MLGLLMVFEGDQADGHKVTHVALGRRRVDALPAYYQDWIRVGYALFSGPLVWIRVLSFEKRES